MFPNLVVLEGTISLFKNNDSTEYLLEGYALKNIS